VFAWNLCDKVNCTYRGGEKDYTKHDAATALVTHSQTTVLKFQQPKTMHCASSSQCSLNVEIRRLKNTAIGHGAI